MSEVNPQNEGLLYCIGCDARPTLSEAFCFDERRYTSPTMMRAALDHFGRKTTDGPCDFYGMFDERVALVRVQWEGPWTALGANPKWAYRHTHWVACWLDRNQRCVFDCNGGIRPVRDWEHEIVPLLTNYPRANGDWFPTHVWRLEPVEVR